MFWLFSENGSISEQTVNKENKKNSGFGEALQ